MGGNVNDRQVQQVREENESPVSVDGTEEKLSAQRTLDRFERKHGIERSEDQTNLEIGKKVVMNVLDATKDLAQFGIRAYTSTTAVKAVLPFVLGPVGTTLVNGFLPLQEVGSDVSTLAGGDNRETVVDKRAAKAVEFKKVPQIAWKYINAFTDLKLNLKDNIGNALGGIEKEEKLADLRQRYGDTVEKPFLLLKNALETYTLAKTASDDQTFFDDDIRGLFLAMILMARNPQLTKDELKIAGPVFKTKDKRERFDRVPLVAMAKEYEIQDPVRMRIMKTFNQTWKGLKLSDEKPFMRLSGEGATDFARQWCDKVDESPVEMDADDLFEILTGNRPKDARERAQEKNPPIERLLKGFCSRIEPDPENPEKQGSPTAPLIVTGFDPSKAEHASLLPLLQGADKVSFPYRDIPNVFQFNLKGVAVFLCEEDSPLDKAASVEVPADASAAAGKDKGKEKKKDKADKIKDGGEKAEKKKDKEKAADGDKENSKAFASLKGVPHVEFPAPSKERRKKKLEEAIETVVPGCLDRIFQDDAAGLARALRKKVKDTISREEFKDLFAERSMKQGLSLQQAETAIVYFAQQVASMYREILFENQGEGNGLPGSSSDANRPAETQLSSATMGIEEELDALVAEYFKRFEEPSKSKPKSDDKASESSALLDLLQKIDLNVFKEIDLEALAEAHPKPLWAQPAGPLPKGQTTLERYSAPPLLKAVKAGKLDELRQKVRSGEWNLKEDVDAQGNTALHLAVENKHLDIIDFILEEDISLIDVANHNGQTAEDLAYARKNRDVVRHILNKMGALQAASS